MKQFYHKGNIDGFTLKAIACITMLINHIGIVLFSNNTFILEISKVIGRIAFPIFAFLLIEGFLHSSNLFKYFIRLGGFALLSEIAFDCAFYGIDNREQWLQHQNVLFTLLIGLLTVAMYDKVQIKYRHNIIVVNFYSVITLLLGSLSAILLKTDYSYYGIFMIMIIYLFHFNKKWMIVGLILLIGFFRTGIELFQIVALLFIWNYSGEEGKKAQKFFYAFYPLHLFILALLSEFFVK